MITEELFNEFVDKIRNIHDDYLTLIYNDYKGNYIDFSYDYIDTLELNKKGYEKYDKLIQESSLDLENISIYCSNDGSGYDYWTKTMEESNYFHIVIVFNEDSTEVTDEEIDKLYVFMANVTSKYCDIRFDKDFMKKKGATHE